ncbi:MAG TPA: precorrin-2 C(20)-methyltransferase [Geminicoccaceae bacterium]|nr:precorrin-2 C(20)-methyltransferase [Geminicoccus sp.]HMU51683.1 precorrin-2 C(20)-methyltransferase [Geminicoccaceae bacterium]
MRLGRLTAVGVGPGDPELLTLKAAHAIQRATVIAFVGGRGRGNSRARQVAAAHIRPGVRELAFALPGVGEIGEASPIHDVMATAIAGELDRGQDVAFLCEGDPLLQGGFGRLVERLQDRYPCSVIPGVPMLAAAAAASLRPLAGAGAPLVVLPASMPEQRLEQLAKALGHVVILQVGRHVAKVRGVLRASGMLADAVLIENAGLADERVRDLATTRDDIVGHTAMVIARKEPAADGDGPG